MIMVNESFPYQPLDSATAQFRLVRLSAQSEDYELANFSLKTATWTTLSYCWGTDEATEDIVVNGTPFSVRQNLHGFLQQMGPDEWFFIDALCIDQNNVHERSAQVGLMQEIYLRAEHNLVWLSVDLGGFRPVDQKITAELSRKTGVDYSGLWWNSRQEIPGVGLEFSVRILENPFWSRLWIVQELLLSRSTTVLVDGVSMPLPELIETLQVVIGRIVEDKDTEPESFLMNMTQQAIAQIGPTLATPIRHMIIGMRILADKKEELRIPFHTAIRKYSSQNCTLIHDKVFGLLGLISDNLLVPDYTLPLMELFAATFANHILSSRSDPSATKIMPGAMNPANEYLSDLEVLAAFDLDPFHPVIWLITNAVYTFFGIEVGQGHANLMWMSVCAVKDPDSAWKSWIKKWTVGKSLISKYELWSFKSDMTAQMESLMDEFSGLDQDALMEAPSTDGKGDVRMRSEWESMAIPICEQMWKRFDREKYTLHESIRPQRNAG